MTDKEKKVLMADTDGLLAYEFIANHIDGPIDDIDAAIAFMTKADSTGQYLTSAARYLHAVDAPAFAAQVARLIEATIERDREHKYLPIILESIYGSDYESRTAELCAADNNFRRIYKRLFPNSII